MIVFDLETTGFLEPSLSAIDDQPKIIEFGAVKIHDTTLEEQEHGQEEYDEAVKLQVDGKFPTLISTSTRLHFMLDPKEPLRKEVVEKTKIKDENLEGRPIFAEMWKQIAEFFLGERLVGGQNVMYDITVLAYELDRIGKERNFPWPMERFCSKELSEKLFGRPTTLGAMAKELLGIDELPSWHRAMHDALMTAKILKELRNKIVASVSNQ